MREPDCDLRLTDGESKITSPQGETVWHHLELSRESGFSSLRKKKKTCDKFTTMMGNFLVTMRGKYGPGLWCSCRFSLQELIVFVLGSFSAGLTAAKSPWVLRRAAGRWVELRVGGYLHIQRCSHGCKEEGEGTFLKWSPGCWGSPQPQGIYDRLDPTYGE